MSRDLIAVESTQAAFQTFVKEAAKLGHPIRTIKEEVSSRVLFDYLTGAKKLLQAKVETDPVSMLPFCQEIFEWMSEGNQAYLVKSEKTPDGISLIFECMGGCAIDDVFGNFEVIRMPRSAEEIYNFRVDRPLLFLEGKLEQPWQDRIEWEKTPRKYGKITVIEMKINARHKQTIKVDSPLDWLHFFVTQCGSSYDTYMNQFQKQAERIVKEAQEGKEVRTELNELVELVRMNNRMHLSNLIEIVYQELLNRLT